MLEDFELKDYMWSLKSVSDVNSKTKNQMFHLLDAHFHNVQRENFEKDLATKDFVFLLQDPNEETLLGFSTQQLLKTAKGERVVFSGDTIVDPSAWRSVEFPRAWGLWMLNLLNQEPLLPLYWLLISKGHRTYRFLPTFFLDYSPSIHRGYTSHEKEIISDVGKTLFGENLVQNDQGYFFVRATNHSQFLREHLIDSNSDRLNHREITFFERINPDYFKGTELVCLLKFSVENMRPFCKRMLNVDGNIKTQRTVQP